MIEGGIIRSYAEGIAKGYLRLARSVGAVLLAIIAIAGISLVIVTPLWFFATRYTTLYTTISVCGLAAAVMTPLVIRLSKEPSRLKGFIKRAARVVIYLALAGLLYVVVLLYVWGSFAIAVPLTIVHVAVVGLILYGKHSSRR